ncbi:TPA: DUF2933 domain-containing protein [Legionella pneumophila]|uniref:DUF2933 domain-containing protein n=1 Tax=Legionella pneumophila TaxID=446 RepID=UPI0005CAD1F1|nr:DUF2933 domain-containing protein [Legionella pneumophila]HCC3243580.1 DUF2933 domain-containing protein [Legionella pneumophila subsp. pneumophila]MCZ4683310.1 DUF2933 domain-containing protein [Legionella pneumophila]HDV5789949.1 DUF2933 domain-containing protein [Legionella pneumophila]HDV5798932.1 DUF2933 domain-containing protein [Legionella pneumophila]HDV5948497.1 DUF2933 domain-containing protein [Legionella pneumophila]
MSPAFGHHPKPPKPQKEKGFWRSPSGLMAIIIIGIIGYYLIVEHGAHIVSFLGASPLVLLVLLCPLMHLFMHGGHGKHEGNHHHKSDDEDKDSSENKD